MVRCSVAPGQNTLSVVSSPTPPMNTFDIKALSISKSDPQDGWIQYRIGFAIKNMSLNIGYLDTTNTSTISTYDNRMQRNNSIKQPSFGISLPIYTLNSLSSTVDTKEGHQFGADVALIYHRWDQAQENLLVLPPQQWITGTQYSSLFAVFKVPETLNPTLLTIRPGISTSSDSYPLLLSIDPLEEATLQVEAPTDFNELPVSIPIDSELDLVLSEATFYNIERPEGVIETVVQLTATAKNKDVTGDQLLGFSSFLTDSHGRVYSPFDQGSFWSACNFSTEVGPGQELTLHVCFDVVSPDSNPKPLYLYFVSELSNRAYIINITKTVQCTFDSRGLLCNE